MSAPRRRWFRLPVADRALSERDVDAELAAHLAQRVERLMATGLTEAEARAEAERRLGGVAPARYALTREALERDRRLSLLDRLRSVLDDVRYAGRSVFRQLAYAAVVILTLALGIGANAVMFGVVDRLLLSGPAEVVEPERLYRFYATIHAENGIEEQTFQTMNGPLLMAFREGVTSLAGISGYFFASRILGSGLEARPLSLEGVTASYFPLLGVQPVLGRFIDEAETAPGEMARVIVLSHRFWQTEFGGSRDVLGATLQLSGQSYTIIGVAPPGFTGVELAPRDGWIPLAAAWGSANWATEWVGYYLPVVGRLRAGATVERAAAEATAAWRVAAVDGPESRREARMSLAGIRADRQGRETLEARVARWLAAVSGIVLLIACANVANLYVARGLRRRREIAVRLALGVSRGRLMRLLLAESMLLAVLGGIAALVVAYWGAGIVRDVLLPNVEWTTSPLNVRVLTVAGGLTLITGVITGLVPALLSVRPTLSPELAGSGTAAPAPGRARGALAVTQAAFCVLLLVGAGVFVRSLWNVHRLDLGLDADRVLALTFDWETPAELSDEERVALRQRRRLFLDEAVERVAAVPGVEHAGLALGAAFRGSYFATVRVPGLDSVRPMPGGGPYWTIAGPTYFETLGMRVLRGRVFEHADGAGSEPVTVVSRTTAEALWPGVEAVGRCVYLGAAESTPCSRVIGVVEDTRRFNLREEAALQFYVPIGQEPAWMSGALAAFTVLARAARAPEPLVEPLRRALHSYEPSLRYVSIQPFSEHLAPQRRPWRLGAVLFVLCGVLALAIAMIGLYSVIMYLVLHRRHEIGVRMALGAERRRVVGLVLRQALGLAGAGLLIGGVVAYLAAPWLEPLLFETAPRDSAVFAMAAGTLALAALAAGVVPAWRASRIPPTEALRDV